MTDSIAINYVGGPEILTNPIYVTYSSIPIGDQTANDIKTSLKLIVPNMDNLAIISYLSTLLRAVTLVA